MIVAVVKAMMIVAVVKAMMIVTLRTVAMHIAIVTVAGVTVAMMIVAVVQFTIITIMTLETLRQQQLAKLIPTLHRTTLGTLHAHSNGKLVVEGVPGHHSLGPLDPPPAGCVAILLLLQRLVVQWPLTLQLCLQLQHLQLQHLQVIP